MTSDDQRPDSAAGDASETLTRAKLLEAARDIFIATGYRGATLDSIAARAGFTKGAVYWHFPNKQALFLALVEDSIAATTFILEHLLNHHGDDPAAMRAAAARFADGVDERETLPIFGVELEIESRGDPSFRRLHQDLIDKHEKRLAVVLGRYFDVIGESPPMALGELATTLTCLFKGFALTRQNRPEMRVTSARAIRILLQIRD